MSSLESPRSESSVTRRAARDSTGSGGGSAAAVSTPPVAAAVASPVALPYEEVEWDVDVKLSPLEEHLFALLVDVVRYHGLKTTPRVAGGWVRDKLLGIKPADCKAMDIDIALDDILGCEFAETINAWLQLHGREHHEFGVIQRNSDKSKHLETARVKVLSLNLDLVNLRTETYTTDSRIPQIQIGTPLEDALRRDLTINSLFYNLITRKVEDFTGEGVMHLRRGIIKTPLPPQTTLLDDPLRVLRAIRFANRFNFTVDRDLYSAFCDKKVHRALDEKVSRERIGREVSLMVSCRRPLQAVGLICEVGIFHIVFQLPESLLELPPFDLSNACLGCLINLDSLTHHHFDGTEVTSEKDTRIARFAALTAPLRNVHYVDEKRNRPTPVARYVLQDRLRLNSKTVDAIILVHECSCEFQALMRQRSEKKLERRQVAPLLRRAGVLWKLALMIGLISEMYPAKAARTYSEGLDAIPEKFERPERMIVAQYKQLQDEIITLGLDGVWDMKPRLDGREVLRLLPNLPKGPEIGRVMEDVINWQVEHPTGDDEKLREWLLEKNKAFC